tara:strand:+ start:51 stop:1061 length:1011 start_codon:yes stop_codon:yes gene_type:complete
MKIILATNAPKDAGLPYFYHLELEKKLETGKLVYLYSANIKLQRSLYARFLNRVSLLFKISSNNLMKRILEEIKNTDEKSSIILFNTSGLNEHHLKRLKQYKNVELYNYLSDNPLGMSNLDLNLTIDSFSFMKKVFVFSRSLIPIVYQYGAKEVVYIPFGYCKKNHLINLNQIKTLHENQVIYFGTWGPLIEEWLYPLRDFNLKIYGNDWGKSKYKELRMVSSYKAGMQSDMSEKASNAKVVINFIRAQHGSLSSGKTFELAASGACIVTNRTLEQLEFFNEKEFNYFDSKEEMVEIVTALIKDETKNFESRRNSHNKVINHSYEERASELLDNLI